MATIFYFHGFGSTGEGPKVDSLRQALPNHTIVAPDIPSNPKVAVTVLSKLIREAASYPVVFIGTSLGGFWANYMAQKFDAPAVIVNPSTNPAASMQSRIGTVFMNYKTNAPIEITQDDVNEFTKLEDELAELYNGALVHLFVAKDDDVISCEQTLKNIPYSASCTISESGGHRYLEEWDKVVSAVSRLVAPKELVRN